MRRRPEEVTHDRKPRLPPSASVEEIARRARGEALLARVAVVLLIPIAVASAVSFLHDLDFALVASLLARDGVVDPDRILELDARAGVMVALPLVASFPFMLAFLIWTHRAYHNAHWTGAGRWMRFTPGAAVGSFFVPFRNLVRPFQVFQELARASEPAELEEPPRAPDTTAGYREPALSPAIEAPVFRSPPLSAWWATWIGAHVAAYIGARMARSLDLEVAANGGWVLMVSDLVALASAVCVGLVVHRIARRRHEVFRRLLALAAPFSRFSPDASAHLDDEDDGHPSVAGHG